MSKINEQIERLRGLVRKCYATVAGKNGTVPEVGERNMENLPNAIASTHDTLEELTITANGEYIPQEGVDGFSKVVAEFDTSSLPKVKVTTFRVTNACINDNGIWEGESLIDTSECTSFAEIFNGCSKIQILKAGNWNTSKVTNMSNMFRNCSSLKELEIGDWNTQSFIALDYAFMYAKCDKILDLTKWDTRKVTSMRSIFYGFKADVIDISGWSGASLEGGLGVASPFAGITTSIVGEKSIEYVINNNIGCLIGLRFSIDPYFRDSINRASLRALINGLADRTGMTAQTLTLIAASIAKLTDEDIAIATNKNWTITRR
jgi:surface protein